jgi:putative transposase
MATRQRYPSDLTDGQWAIVGGLLPPEKERGAKREVDLREVVNTILYISRTGCQWGFIPHDLLKKSTVFDYFKAWQRDGTWQKVTDALRRRVREGAGRDPEPRTAAIDSQTAPTHHQGAESEVDGGKNVKGRKRHIVVCSMGLLLAVSVTAANVHEGTHSPVVLAELSAQTTGRLETVFADSKYHCEAAHDWQASPQIKYKIEVVKREGKEFKLLPKRWVVERTYAWMGYNRRLSKDYERTTSSSEAWCRISMIHLMLKRISPGPKEPEFRYPRPDPDPQNA